MSCASEEVSTDFTYGGASAGQSQSGSGNDSPESSAESSDDPLPEPSSDSSSEAPSDCTDPSGTSDADPVDLEGREDCGEIIYFADCGPCHGDSGGPNPTSNWSDFDDASLASIVLEGIMEMPPQNLTPQQVADVIAFIRYEFD